MSTSSSAASLSASVASLRSSLSLLDSSIAILDSGISDFPRLSTVLTTTRVSLLSPTNYFFQSPPPFPFSSTSSTLSKYLPPSKPLQTPPTDPKANTPPPSAFRAHSLLLPNSRPSLPRLRTAPGHNSPLTTRRNALRKTRAARTGARCEERVARREIGTGCGIRISA